MVVVFFHPAGWHGRLYWHASLQGSHFSHHNNCPPGSSRSHTSFNWEYGASQPRQHMNPEIALYKFPCSTGVISFQQQQNDPTAWKLSSQVLLSGQTPSWYTVESSPSTPFPWLCTVLLNKQAQDTAFHMLQKQLPFGTFTVIKHLLIHCGRVTQICVFNMVKLGTSASSP